MLKPERDELLMPSLLSGYSSEHFLLRCLQFDQNIAMLTNMLKEKKKKKKKKFTTAAVDNIDPSPTTANVSFHGTSVSLDRQMENEGEKRVLSGSVDTSTRK